MSRIDLYSLPIGITIKLWVAGDGQISIIMPDWLQEAILTTNEVQVVFHDESDDEHPQPSKRIPGCQSLNHEECYGELWQCAVCGKRVCYAEGTDNLPDLCDDCWVKAQGEP